MEITGFTKRAFFEQTGNFSFLSTLTFSQNSGFCELGFSGQTKIPFYFNNGKIIDKSGYFFSSYSENIPINFSGNISPNTIDYFVNNETISLGLPRDTGYLNYFYIDGTNNNLDLELYINGDVPNFSFDDNITYDTGSLNIPVSITNNSNIPFKIFSGQFLGNSGLFNLSGFPTGLINGNQSKTFYFNQNNVGGANQLSILMYSDFGREIITINASGITEIPPSYSINLIGPSTITAGSTGVYYCSFYDDFGVINIQPSITYISGSGNISGQTIFSGNYSGNLTGIVTGNAPISETFTISGTDGTLTGFFNYTLSQLIFPTGGFLFPYSVNGTGLGSVSSYNGPATGIITGLVSGNVNNQNNGQFIAFQSIFGIPSLSYSSLPTGYNLATGSINLTSPQKNDLLFIGNPNIALGYQTDYFSASNLSFYLNNNTGKHLVISSFSGNTIYLTGINKGNSGNSTILQTSPHNVGSITLSNSTLIGGIDLGLGTLVTPNSNFTGLLNQTFYSTGLVNQPVSGLGTGIYNYIQNSKTFTGTWDMLTGLSINNLVDVISLNNFNSTNISGTVYSSNIDAFYIYLPYNNNTSINDVISLNITGIGLNTGISLIISGNLIQ